MPLDEMSDNPTNADSADTSDRTSKLLRKLQPRRLLNHLRARKHNEQLEQKSLDLKRTHSQALEDAHSEHELVRMRAEKASWDHEIAQLRRHKKELKRHEDRRKEVEAARKEADEEERRLMRDQHEAELRDAEREIARKAQAQADKSEAQRRLQQKIRDAELEAERRSKEEHERKAREKAERLRPPPKLQLPSPAPSATLPPAGAPTTVTPAGALSPIDPTTSTTTSSTPGFPNADAVTIHRRYLGLHQNLKKLRALINGAKRDYPDVKKHLSDSRRAVTKCMGLFLEDSSVLTSKQSELDKARRDRNYKIPTQNTVIQQDLVEAIRQALSIHGPTVDIRSYIVMPLPTGIDLNTTQVPAILPFLLNAMSKAAVNQFISLGSKPTTIDPIGLAVYKVFSEKQFQWQGITFIDIFLAKLHKTIPVIFGVKGDERSEVGRDRLGWARDGPKGPQQGIQQTTDKWTGLGAGFAAVFLRLQNNPPIGPRPTFHWWQAMSRLLNTPVAQRTQAHFYLVKAMVQFSVLRIMVEFGEFGLTLLRRAVIDFPKESGNAEGAAALLTADFEIRDQYKLTL